MFLRKRGMIIMRRKKLENKYGRELLKIAENNLNSTSKELNNSFTQSLSIIQEKDLYDEFYEYYDNDFEKDGKIIDIIHAAIAFIIFYKLI